MRKLIWCCSAAGLLATGGFLSLAYYAYRCPDSVVGRSMKVIAQASVAIQPLNGLTSLTARVSRANAPAHDGAGSIEECIPDDPQPLPPEANDEEAGRAQKDKEFLDREIEADAAPIVIGEEDPMPREEIAEAIPPVDGAGMQGKEVPSKSYPVFMPYCSDDEDEPETPPKMPRAEAGDDNKTGASHAKVQDGDFKEWMELFEENKEDKTATVEELPAPKKLAPNAEPKCQEDIHRHEHYSGCPRTTCPYLPTKRGGEESSEEPRPPANKSKPSKDCKDKEKCPRTQGVDTMEYRKSDAGLDEYGPGPLH